MMKINRRGFLKTSAGAAAAAGVTLWLPRFARGTGPGQIRHVILIYLGRGVRWMCSFGAQASIKQNPWGLLPWDLVPQGQAEHLSTQGTPWQMSRMFHLRPVPAVAPYGFPEAYDRLSSLDPADYNFEQPTLQRWPGQPQLPSFCSIAHQISVIHCDAYPGSPALLDHAAGQQNLFTCSTSGTNGLSTLFNAVLKGRTRLPAIAVNSPGFALGTGKYAGSRPLVLTSATALPTTDPGRNMSEWARKYEAVLDAGQGQRRQSFAAQAIANFALDKRSGDENITTLLSNSLKLATAPVTTAFGETISGEPVTNGMLREVFGVNSAEIDPSDILNDAYRSLNQPVYEPGRAGWTNNPFGLNGALAVRFLQYGSSVVSLTVGDFDTHSNELFSTGRTHPSQMIQFSRMLTGLEFALKNIKDPDTGGSLWETTVIVAGSEFGRQGPNITDNGFNTGRGSDHSREQYFPILGGPLSQRGQLITESGGRPLHMNSIWTSLLAGMGAESDYLRPEKFPPIQGLINYRG